MDNETALYQVGNFCLFIPLVCLSVLVYLSVVWNSLLCCLQMILVLNLLTLTAFSFWKDLFFLFLNYQSFYKPVVFWGLISIQLSVILLFCDSVLSSFSQEIFLCICITNLYCKQKLTIAVFFFCFDEKSPKEKSIVMGLRTIEKKSPPESRRRWTQESVIFVISFPSSCISLPYIKGLLLRGAPLPPSPSAKIWMGKDKTTKFSSKMRNCLPLVTGKQCPFFTGMYWWRKSSGFGNDD